jgi:hypothetical protein
MLVLPFGFHGDLVRLNARLKALGEVCRRVIDERPGQMRIRDANFLADTALEFIEARVFGPIPKFLNDKHLIGVSVQHWI